MKAGIRPQLAPEEGFMQQVIIDFGEVSLFGKAVGLRIYGYALMLVLGFLLGISLVGELVLSLWKPAWANRLEARWPAVRQRRQWLGLAVLIVGIALTLDHFGSTVSLRIYGYGLMLVVGFLLGIYLARWRARRFGESADAVTTLGLLALVGGVVGSRVAFVIEKWDAQFAWREDPLPEILNITSGGLVYYGGAALALASVVVYLRLRRMPIRRYLDIIAPSLMIGLAFGRMGCLLNGCCYGGRCRADFPLAMRFPYASKPLLRLARADNIFGGAAPAPVFLHQAVTLGDEDRAKMGVPQWLFQERPDGEVLRNERGEAIVKMPAELTAEQARQAAHLRSLPVQPAQVFGVVNSLLIAGVLLLASRLRSREGQVFALMLILYPITRFVLECIRGDNTHNVFKLELTHNQYTSIGMITVGLLMLFVLRWLPAGAGPGYLERAAAAEARKPAPARQRKGKG